MPTMWVQMICLPNLKSESRNQMLGSPSQESVYKFLTLEDQICFEAISVNVGTISRSVNSRSSALPENNGSLLKWLPEGLHLHKVDSLIILEGCEEANDVAVLQAHLQPDLSCHLPT